MFKLITAKRNKLIANFSRCNNFVSKDFETTFFQKKIENYKTVTNSLNPRLRDRNGREL